MLAELAQAGAAIRRPLCLPPTPPRTTATAASPSRGCSGRAARELGLDLSRAVVIGDAARDLIAGARLGLPGILVRTGKGRKEEQDPDIEPVFVAEDLGGAVEWILGEGEGVGV